MKTESDSNQRRISGKMTGQTEPNALGSGLIFALERPQMARSFVPHWTWPWLASLAFLQPWVIAQISAAGPEGALPPANQAKNLARANCGTHLIWISPNQMTPTEQDGAADDLLLDDNTFNRELTVGQHSFIVSLADVSNLSRFTFINEQGRMSGTIQLSVSNYRLGPNDPHWVASKSKFAFGNQRFVSVPLPATEGKYVKVVLNISKPGTIAGIGLYGQTSLASFSYQNQSRGQDAQAAATTINRSASENLTFNFANIYAHARITSVSSGATGLAARMIDDDATTTYQFSPNDAQPTVVIELSGSERLRRVSVIYDAEPGAMEVFPLNRAPEPGALDNLQPVMTVKDETGAGKAVAEFNPRGARWVALRWKPAGQKYRRSFTVAEIGAFSDALPPILESQAIPPQMAQSTLVTGLPPSLPAPPVVVPASQ